MERVPSATLLFNVLSATDDEREPRNDGYKDWTEGERHFVGTNGAGDWHVRSEGRNTRCKSGSGSGVSPNGQASSTTSQAAMAQEAQDAGARHTVASNATAVRTAGDLASALSPPAGALSPDLEESLQQLSPQTILEDLLGDLFIHPDRLEMQELLGEGTFATVHRASLLVEGGRRTEVAVKRLKPEVLGDVEDVKEFLTECNLTRKLMHRHIVTILGIGAMQLRSLDSVRQSMFLVMEPMEGGSLKMMVIKQMTAHKDAIYDSHTALQWCMSMSSALSYLHDVCKPMIIHRDLKLENILVSGGSGSQRIVKLADFGLHKRAHFNVHTGVLMASGRFDCSSDCLERSYYGGLDQSYYAESHVSGGGGTNGHAASQQSNPSPTMSGHLQDTLQPQPAATGTHGISPFTGAASLLQERGQRRSSHSRHSRHSSDMGESGSRDSTGHGSNAALAALMQSQSLAAPPPLIALMSMPGQKNNVQHLHRLNSARTDAAEDPSSPFAVTSRQKSETSMQRQMLALMALDKQASMSSSGWSSRRLPSRLSIAQAPEPPAKAATESLKRRSGSPRVQRVPSAESMQPISEDKSLLVAKPAVMKAIPENKRWWMKAGGASCESYIDPEEEVPVACQVEVGSLDKSAASNVVQPAAGPEAIDVAQGSGIVVSPFATDLAPLGSLTAAAPDTAGVPEDKQDVIPRSGTLFKPTQGAVGTATVASGQAVASSEPAADAASFQAAAATPSFQPLGGPQLGPTEFKFVDATQQVGSLMYMAPELFNGGEYNEKVDVFSFGIMAFELFSGKLMSLRSEFMTGGQEAVMQYCERRSQGERERLPSRWPAPLRDLIASCWAQDPEQRPAFHKVLLELRAVEKARLLEGMEARIVMPTGCGCVLM